MAVDFLVISADSSLDFYPHAAEVKKDFSKTAYNLQEAHTLLGMRTLGPSKVAWVARRHGYTSQVIQKIQLLTVEELITLTEPFVDENTVIGLSTTFLIAPRGDYSKEGFLKKLTPHSALFKMIKLTEHFKHKYNTKVIVGGAQAIFFTKILSGDYVLSGEAENTLPQLLDKIKRAGIQKKPYDWSITTCDFDWHKTDAIVKKEPLPLETARGCIFKCKFCQYDQIGKRIGTFERPLDHVRDYLINNYEKYHTTYYWFMDDTFNDNDERVNQFCDMVESLPFRINYMGYLRMDLLSKFPKTARRLYELGLVGCHIGAESFHPTAASAIGKGWNAKEGKDFLDHWFFDICDENVMIKCGNIIGLPGEKESDLHQTVAWYAKRPHIHTQWSPLHMNNPKKVPPEQTLSEFEKNAEKYGYHFYDENMIHLWRRGDMTFELACEIRNRIVLRLKRNNMIAGESWMALHYLSLLNITPKQAWKKGWPNIYRDHMADIDHRNQQYFEKVKQLTSN